MKLLSCRKMIAQQMSWDISYRWGNVKITEDGKKKNTSIPVYLTNIPFQMNCCHWFKNEISRCVLEVFLSRETLQIHHMEKSWNLVFFILLSLPQTVTDADRFFFKKRCLDICVAIMSILKLSGIKLCRLSVCASENCQGHRYNFIQGMMLFHSQK